MPLRCPPGAIAGRRRHNPRHVGGACGRPCSSSAGAAAVEHSGREGRRVAGAIRGGPYRTGPAGDFQALAVTGEDTSDPRLTGPVVRSVGMVTPINEGNDGMRPSRPATVRGLIHARHTTTVAAGGSHQVPGIGRRCGRGRPRRRGRCRWRRRRAADTPHRSKRPPSGLDGGRLLLVVRLRPWKKDLGSH